MKAQNQLLDDLFTIASDHNRFREDRVDDMVPLLLSVEEEKFLPDTTTWQRSDSAWRDFKPQVLRQKQAEQAFFVDFVQKIFKKYDDVMAFSWNQSQDYPGYYGGYFFSFDILWLSINGHSMIPLVGLEDEWGNTRYAFLETDLIVSPPLFLMKIIEKKERISWKEADFKARDRYHKMVKEPFDVFLIFLQSLHRAYHTNYFIDLFGWFSDVQIDRNGLNLKNVIWEPKNRVE